MKNAEVTQLETGYIGRGPFRIKKSAESSIRCETGRRESGHGYAAVIRSKNTGHYLKDGRKEPRYKKT